MSNASENNSLRTAAKVGHSLSFPHTTHHQGQPLILENFEYSLQVNSPLYSYSLSTDNSWDLQNLSGHNENSANSRTKDPQENDNIIQEEDETEDIFKPSDDTFFRVKKQPSVMPFNKITQDLQNNSDAMSSAFNNGIIPKSDMFLDTTQRSFKLVKSSTVSSTPVSDSSGNGNQETDDHLQEICVSVNADQEADTYGRYSSCGDSEVEASQEKLAI